MSDTRRRFSKQERGALYVAADGRCSQCGAELEPSWHADHVEAYSRGGETDVRNGQALCPTCNLRKGASEGLRQWQTSAMQRYLSAGAPRDFLVEATPGAGKTRFALALVSEMLAQGMVDRIAIVVPTDALREQWAVAAASFGLSVMPVREPEDYDKTGYQGCVVTYAQLAVGNGSSLLRRSTKAPTVAILDEIHHAGEQRAWGDGLTYALEHARNRIGLTGTPWRRNAAEPIPFVSYGSDGKVVVDYSYGYGEAVADGVCRAIEFHAYDGEVRWVDCGKITSAELGGDLDDADVGAALDAALHPNHQWMPALLAQAVDALDEIREEVPNAGGLVVADNTQRARAYAELLRKLTGEDPTVVVSEDGREAQENLERYRRSRSKWLVAIRMVSEGIDIPRLAVGVYATRARTPLFFRQLVGRFVRISADDFNARLYMPAIPALMAHASEIEDELRHQLDMEAKRDELARQNAQDQQRTFELREPLSASEAVFAQAILAGQEISPEERAAAEVVCREAAIPTRYAISMAQVLRKHAGRPIAEVRVTPVAAVEPRHRRERVLRAEVDKLSGKLGYALGLDPREGKREVNLQLLRDGFPPRKQASIEDLERMRDHLAAQLGRVQ